MIPRLEIKLTASPSLEDLRRLDRIACLIGADRRFLISKTTDELGDEQRASLGLEPFLTLLLETR